MNEKDYLPCRYNGNGTTKEFPFKWKVFTDSELIIKLIDSDGNEERIKLGADYTVQVEAMGGNIICKAAPDSDKIIDISRRISNYQGSGYSTSVGFQGSEIEKSFDKVSCCLQDMDYNIETFKTDFSAKTDEQILDFKTYVDGKMESVYNAAELIDTTMVAMENAVETCIESAESSVLLLMETQEQATKAENEAIRAENYANSINPSILANTSLSNLTPAGEERLRHPLPPATINSASSKGLLSFSDNTISTIPFACTTSSGTRLDVAGQSLEIVPTKYKNCLTVANVISTTVQTGSLASALDNNIQTGVGFYSVGGASGVCFIGSQDLTSKISYVKLYQGYYSAYPDFTYSVTSAKIQIDNGSGWQDIQTVITKDYWKKWQTIKLNNYTFNADGYRLRVLANSNIDSDHAWIINELQLLTADPTGDICLDETIAILCNKDGLLEQAPAAVNAFFKPNPLDYALGTRLFIYDPIQQGGFKLVDKEGVKSWVADEFCPLADVQIKNAVISDVSTRPFNSNGYEVHPQGYIFKSDWIKCSPGGLLVYNHNLGIPIDSQKIKVLFKCLSANNGYVIGDTMLVENSNSYGGVSERNFGFNIYGDRNTAYLQQSQNYIFTSLAKDGSMAAAAGEWAVKVLIGAE